MYPLRSDVLPQHGLALPDEPLVGCAVRTVVFAHRLVTLDQIVALSVVAQEEERYLRVVHALLQLLDAEVVEVVMDLGDLMRLSLLLVVAEFSLVKLVDSLNALDHFLLVDQAAQHEKDLHFVNRAVRFLSVKLVHVVLHHFKEVRFVAVPSFLRKACYQIKFVLIKPSEVSQNGFIDHVAPPSQK